MSDSERFAFNEISDQDVANFLKGKDQTKHAVLCCVIIAIVMILSVSVIFFRNEERLSIVETSIVENESNIKSIGGLIAKLETDLNNIQEESVNNKNDLSYIYAKIDDIQNDIKTIKQKLKINDKSENNKVQKMRDEDIAFLKELETLVIEGKQPFSLLFEKYKNKDKVIRCNSWKKLSKYKNVKSIDDLKKEFEKIADSEFGVTVNESFWEKQKRVIKEKIMSAIRIKKDGKDKKIVEKNKSDIIVDIADCLENGDIKRAIELLDKIDSKSKSIKDFIIEAQKRSDLNDAFYSFKTEFIASTTHE